MGRLHYFYWQCKIALSRRGIRLQVCLKQESTHFVNREEVMSFQGALDDLLQYYTMIYLPDTPFAKKFEYNRHHRQYYCILYIRDTSPICLNTEISFYVQR